jgi:hypothetical protein
MTAGENSVARAARKLVGASASPVCKIERTTMTTFDNRTVPFHIDYCFHLLSADCSSERQFAVLTRTMKPGTLKLWYNVIWSNSEIPNDKILNGKMLNTKC